MADASIVTVDLSPFFNGDKSGMKDAKEVITRTCSDYGFFQVVNHGVPPSLMAQALDLSKTFFEFPNEEKLKASPGEGAPLPPGGYIKRPDHSDEQHELLLMYPPASSFNIFPNNPPELKEVFEETFSQLIKTGLLVESILNDCLGLPPNFLKEFNHDRSGDFLVALRYLPTNNARFNGVSAHEDGNCFTLLFQDDVVGLEVLKDGVWIPVIPIEGGLIVNVGDVIQVLSNNKFISATHRVIRQKVRSWHSFAYFGNLEGEKWVEPLPKFTEEIGEPAKYRGFFYKDFKAMKMRNDTHPPSDPKDMFTVRHYAIST
ncbi:hypothetical protein GIB67_033351 [Kingdonia uniflora]|uniref:Fe2OG dioxygenase domain-containing protein n=1 Tax=Kingdonia uniflora TaxID=39325 RepID=A0A7J7LTX4_9MAGN|nr:hypothetical protein GIB67_033351 [Kingdonia uniflora]